MMSDQRNTETEAPGAAAAPAPAIAHPALAVSVAWETAVPSCRDYSDVIAELSSLKLVGVV